MSKSTKLWGGRFDKQTDALVERFTESISFDQRLYREDILGSIAHARMLAQCGLISHAECKRIASGLRTIERQIDTGKFPFRIDREDIHMNIEAALIERIGDAGRRLHTARSRNDQVAADLRLWVRRDIDLFLHELCSLQKALLSLARKHQDVILPGFTHLQHAQPVLAAHHLLAYVEMLERDKGRLTDCRRRLNLSPLGACALAGTTLPIDPRRTARELHFEGVMRNSIDAVSDRDFCVEFLAALSLIGVHLSRLAEEWVLWSSAEFGFLEIDDAFCTGSSHMPQKKNPDVLELVRGRTGGLFGELLGLLTLLKGLPLAYNRDLQEDKRHVFRASDSVHDSLRVFTALAGHVRFQPERIEAALECGFLDATALSEYLVLKGVPLRTAHHTVGRIVGYCGQHDKRLSDLSLEQLREYSPQFTEDVRRVLGARNAVRAFRSPGSTSPRRVKVELRRWERILGNV